MHFHGKIYKTETLLAAAWVCTHLVNYNILFITFSPTGPRMLEDGLVVPGTYTTLCTSRRRLETLEEQLRKKALTLKHMKLEIGSIKNKTIVNYC